MRITGVESTELFTGTTGNPMQVIRVTVVTDDRDDDSAGISITGAGVSTPGAFGITGLEPGTPRAAEVPVTIASHLKPGTERQVTVIARNSQAEVEQRAAITVAEPGWTMWMVSHFHYDPVWWSTQGKFTESRFSLPDEDGKLPDARAAIELVQVHLDKARNDPDYKFVLAELDYLKPHFDTCPQDRADLRRLIAEGRVEIVGGTYNEPNTNLTSAESTIRNAVYGTGFQRGVLGADARTSWMLDSFGHDPGFPGLMAAAGMTASSWARGGFHQWGPDDNKAMQFPSEFEWISPDGSGLLTGYMANHYGAGWVLNGPPDLPAAEAAAYNQFRELAAAAATRNVLLPVGADHVIPARWVTDIHRDWNSKYLWPRFVTALPSEFFAAVREEASSRDIWITPQTRDMNPIYTGKDVSYIDTKQAQRSAEVTLTEAERLATLAAQRGAPYPAASLDRAWRLLAFGAHHDAITGVEADQVYLDLLAGWREAWELAEGARADAARTLAGAQAGADGITVFNGLARRRGGMTTVTVRLPEPGTRWLAVTGDGREIPALAEGVGRFGDGSLRTVTLTFRADDVPALGHRFYRLEPAEAPDAPRDWAEVPGTVIENAAYRVSADPARGGTVSVTDLRTGAELLKGPGNELMLQEEYAKHPQWGEGPWHLSPKGPGRGSASAPAKVTAQRCPAGARLVAEFTLGDLRVRQETLLWDGARRVEFRTHVSGSIGQDHLLRVRFPADVPGALPVYQTATAAIGRSFGAPEADSAKRWFTLENPANQWFGLSSAAVVTLSGEQRARQAIGVAEVIVPDGSNASRGLFRDLVASLAAAGVTATLSMADGPRYGCADVDSNLPDVRICVGGPDTSAFTAEVLATSPEHAKLLATLLAEHGSARVWVPASAAGPAAPGSDAGPDLRGARDLPVLIVAGRDNAALAGAVADVTAELGDAAIAAAAVPGEQLVPLADRSLALLNRGTPSGVVTPDRTLYMALMRACSAWPSGIWIDGDRRTTPDGSGFAWQHWSHTFSYALSAGAGDWRSAGFNAEAEDYNHDLLAVQAASTQTSDDLVTVRPANVTLEALKPHGNPLAAGLGFTSDGTVTLRLRERDGRGVRAAVRLAAGVASAHLSDLLEETPGAELAVRDDTVYVDVPAFGTVTLAVRGGGAGFAAATAVAATPAAGDPPPGGAAPGGAAFSRYWLHGTGPAPAGNLPVAVHISPTRVALPSPGATASVRVSVACGPAPASGEVSLVVPPGITASADGSLRYDLAAGGFATWDVTVRAADGAAEGRYFIGARITDEAGRGLEDAALVAVGEQDPPDPAMAPEELFFRLQADNTALQEETELTMLTSGLSLAPGESGELRVRVASRLACELRGQAQLLSPFGTWLEVPDWTRDLRVDAGGEATVGFGVRLPLTARPGDHWWLLVKLMYFGRVRYSESVPLAVAER